MIRQTEQPPRETIPEPMLAHYRLDDSPRRREAGSLLFAATAPDGRPATLQVSADPVTSRRARARFRRLARARAGVGHPALLGVREIGEVDGRVFAATDPFPARSLADLLRDGPLEPALALRLLKAVADGLDAAHAALVVHRTLSAEAARRRAGETRPLRGVHGRGPGELGRRGPPATPISTTSLRRESAATSSSPRATSTRSPGCSSTR